MNPTGWLGPAARLAQAGSALPQPAKNWAHASSVSYGRLTALARMLPDFLICGGQRCGTTSMYRALSQHPAVLKAVWHKGVHYFDTAYQRGPRWYRAHFPLRATANRIEMRLGVPVQTFESSPYYMYHPLTPARIAHDLPQAKLIVLVRDPVERAYSQHAHEVARGFEHEPDFARALALEPSRLRDQDERIRTVAGYHSFSHQHHAYRARGEYIVYLQRMARSIGRDRIHVVDSHRFFTNPTVVYDEVLDFLNLPRLGYPTFERHNARPRPLALPDPLRIELAEHFRPFDQRLRAWLGSDLSWCPQ